MNCCDYFKTSFNVWITYMKKLVMQFPVRGKLKKHGSEFKFFLSRYPENLVATFENCEIFSANYSSYVLGYKASLRGGNYIPLLQTSPLKTSENLMIFWSFRGYRKVTSERHKLPFPGHYKLMCSPFKRQPQKMVKHAQTIRRQKLANYLSVFDHFVRLALQGLKVQTQ